MNYAEQLQRIERKLQSVRKLDPTGERSYGAERHLYRLGKPLTESQVNIFETECRISLPEDYRAFLTTVGGSIDDEQYGAGPYYGIYSLARIANYRGYSSSEKEYNPDLCNSCTVYPNMSEEEWDEASNDEAVYPYRGMMIFGTQGCTYPMMLVLNGEYRGRVVYIDEERSRPPVFTYEKNFLDWYERWLDEILAGYDLRSFGYNIGGDEQSLIRLFQETDDTALQEKCVGSFFKFPSVDEQTLVFLETVAQMESSPVKCLAVQMLVKSDYPRSKPYLTQSVFGTENEKLAAFQAIHWYASKHRDDWTKPILSVLPEIKEERTLNFVSYILGESKDFLQTLLAIPDPSLIVRKKMIEKLGRTFKPDRLDIFYQGLDDPNDIIVLTTLQAVRLITEPGFLSYFEKLIVQYSQRYEKRKQDNPNDNELIEEQVSELLSEKFPRQVWVPQTIESHILWTILACLKPYGQIADDLVKKMTELQHTSIAAIAEDDLKQREWIRAKQEKRKTPWAKLLRLLHWR